jgi:hypothetical protein
MRIRTGKVDLVAGAPRSAAAVVDGPPPRARFSQPRGLCQLHGGPFSGQLLVLDAVGATAVVRRMQPITGER